MLVILFAFNRDHAHFADTHTCARARTNTHTHAIWGRSKAPLRLCLHHIFLQISHCKKRNGTNMTKELAQVDDISVMKS